MKQLTQLPNGFWIEKKDHDCSEHEVERDDTDAICLDCKEHCGVVECEECEDRMSSCCSSGVWSP